MPAPSAKTESSVFLGFLFIILPSAFSVPSARPGVESVIILIHNKCAGVKKVIPSNDDINITKTSAILVDNWN